MEFKLKSEYEDVHLVNRGSVSHSKDWKPEHYPIYAKKYPHMFEEVIEKPKIVETPKVEEKQKIEDDFPRLNKAKKETKNYKEKE